MGQVFLADVETFCENKKKKPILKMKILEMLNIRNNTSNNNNDSDVYAIIKIIYIRTICMYYILIYTLENSKIYVLRNFNILSIIYIRLFYIFNVLQFIYLLYLMYVPIKFYFRIIKKIRYSRF